MSARDGAYVASPAASTSTRRMRSGGEPHQFEPALDFFGLAESTATSDCLASLRPGATMPELPTKERLPTTVRSVRIQPSPSSYVPTMVSSAKKAPLRTSVSFGTSTAVDTSERSPIVAPKERSHTGVAKPA